MHRISFSTNIISDLYAILIRSWLQLGKVNEGQIYDGFLN